MQKGYALSPLKDRGGRRHGIDRRRVFIPEFAPERRSFQERRGNPDRRTRNEIEYTSYLKRNTDRYMEFMNANKGIMFGFLMGFAIWALILSITFKFWF